MESLAKPPLSVSILLLNIAFIMAACGLPSPASTIPVTQNPPIGLPPNSIFGLENNSLSNGAELELISQLGVSWARQNGVLWSEIEAIEGQRDWSQAALLESELAAGSASGLEVILIVRSTPSWAQAVPGFFCGPIAENKLESFASFMGALVSRYSQPPYNVKYWELWNEPDVAPRDVPPDSPFGCWGNPDDEFFGGETYANMLAKVYPAIKAADPDAQVLVGGLLLDCDPRNPPETSPGSELTRDCRSSRFIEGILNAGGSSHFDGISFHAYDYYSGEAGLYGNLNWHIDSQSWGPVLLAKTAYLNDILARFNSSHKYLIIGELAILCGQRGDEEACQTEAFRRTKAAYIVQSYAAALSHSLRANIWYSLRGWRASGLTGRDLVPEQAYRAYQFAVEALEDAKFITSISAFAGVVGYGFQAQDSDVWVLWSKDNKSHQVGLPINPTEVYNMLGEPIPAAGEITVGPEPIYIFWIANRP